MNEKEIMELEENTKQDEENDTSSNYSSDDEAEKLEERCKQLEEQIQENKYLYDAHVELVNLYEKLGELNYVQAGFERFYESFPLTPKLWLQWIQNEKKVATSEKEKQRILNLFEDAVKDYLSIDLWLEYAKYVMDISDLETTRKVLEKALNSIGLHAKDGSLIWDFTREIELASLSVCPENTESWKEQAIKVNEVFRRQLSVPLLGMENTYNEWKVWQESLPQDFKIDFQPVEWGYQKALKLLDLYKPFENELMATDEETEIYEIFKKYVSAVKDPSTIICLYERAVSQLCLNPNLWLDYCNYMFKLGDVALKVSGKSLRNCPWSEELWVMNMRIRENLNEDETEVLKSFEQGVANLSPAPGLQIWFAYIEFVKRNSKDNEKLKKLIEDAIQKIGDYDTTSSLERFQARIYARNGDVKTAISIWNRVVAKQQNKGNLTLWLEFIALIKQFGDVDQTRSLYQRALNSCKDWAYYVAEEWMLFERDVGTLSSVLKCEEKCKPFKKNPQSENNQQQTSQNTEPANDTRTSKKRKFQSEIKVEVKRVKKEVEKLTIEPKKPIEKNPNKTVFISNISPKVDENILKSMFPNAENLEVCRDRKGKSKCFAYVQFSMPEEVMTALARDRELLDGRPVFISNCKPDKNERKPVFKYSSAPEENKLFVRGLPKTLTKEEVMKIFAPFDALDARIVLHKTGQSKGLAYIEFSNPESTKNALKATDQMQIGEHTITVALSAPPPKKSSDEKRVEKNMEPARHSRSRLQMFVPRSVQVKNDPGQNGQVNAPKSNADFRKMLNKS